MRGILSGPHYGTVSFVPKGDGWRWELRDEKSGQVVRFGPWRPTRQRAREHFEAFYDRRGGEF